MKNIPENSWIIKLCCFQQSRKTLQWFEEYSVFIRVTVARRCDVTEFVTCCVAKRWQHAGVNLWCSHRGLEPILKWITRRRLPALLWLFLLEIEQEMSNLSDSMDSILRKHWPITQNSNKANIASRWFYRSETDSYADIVCYTMYDTWQV